MDRARRLLGDGADRRPVSRAIGGGACAGGGKALPGKPPLKRRRPEPVDSAEARGVDEVYLCDWIASLPGRASWGRLLRRRSHFRGFRGAQGQTSCAAILAATSIGRQSFSMRAYALFRTASESSIITLRSRHAFLSLSARPWIRPL